ncbi:hypothetical protein AB4347_20145, partial [Vibrio breoganii]
IALFIRIAIKSTSLIISPPFHSLSIVMIALPASSGGVAFSSPYDGPYLMYPHHLEIDDD